MTAQEFSNEFNILYNNISSNGAPGLDEYEKSVFLSKAQEELIKTYFNPLGNKYREGFDDSPKRQEDFKQLIANQQWYTRNADEADIHQYHPKAKSLQIGPLFTYSGTNKYVQTASTIKIWRITNMYTPLVPTAYMLLSPVTGTTTSINALGTTKITNVTGYKILSSQSPAASDFLGIRIISSTDTNFPAGYYLRVYVKDSTILSQFTFQYYSSISQLQSIRDYVDTITNTSADINLTKITNGLRLDFNGQLDGNSNVYLIDTMNNTGTNTGIVLEIDNPILLAYFRGPTLNLNYISKENHNILVSINESLYQNISNKQKYYQIVPLSKDEFWIKMNKPFKYPLKNQVWRIHKGGDQQEILVGMGLQSAVSSILTDTSTSKTESCGVIDLSQYITYYNANIASALTQLDSSITDTSSYLWDGSILANSSVYSLRYIRRPYPIILKDFSSQSLKINGYSTPYSGIYGICEVNETIQKEILERAVELAKVYYEGTTQGAIKEGQQAE